MKEPLVLELAPENGSLHLLLVNKCPSGVAEGRINLNQRGCESWPEITRWPKQVVWRLLTGDYIAPSSIGRHSHTSVKLWPVEEYIYRKEIRSILNKLLAELGTFSMLPRKIADLNRTEPLPEDFGPRWHAELAEKRKKAGARHKVWTVDADEEI